MKQRNGGALGLRGLAAASGTDSSYRLDESGSVASLRDLSDGWLRT